MLEKRGRGRELGDSVDDGGGGGHCDHCYLTSALLCILLNLRSVSGVMYYVNFLCSLTASITCLYCYLSFSLVGPSSGIRCICLFTISYEGKYVLTEIVKLHQSIRASFTVVTPLIYRFFL